VSQVIELFREAPFDSERVEALCGAFDLASKALHDTARPDIVNEVIAKRIIAFAKTGVTDPVAIAEGVVKELGFKNVP
jgi:hypothetical protein